MSEIKKTVKEIFTFNKSEFPLYILMSGIAIEVLAAIVLVKFNG